MIGFLGKGLIIGVLVSAPMGPVGMLCIQQTLSKGRWHGFATGLGAVLSDMTYAAITCMGMGIVISFVEDNQLLFQFFGSLVLGIFGYYIFQNNPTKSLKKQTENKLSYTQDIVTGFLLTFSNVLIILLYIGLFAHFGFVMAGFSFLKLLTGVFSIGVGAVVWWLFITYIVSRISKWFNLRDIWVLNRIVGSIIIILAVVGILSVVFSRYFNVLLVR